MRKRSKLPRSRAISPKGVLAIVIAVVLVAGAVVGIVDEVKDNRYIAQLEARIAQLEGGGAVPAVVASNYAPDEPAAEFDGGIVTVAEAAQEYSITAYYYDMMGVPVEEYAEDAKMDVLKTLAEDKVMEAKAKELGVYELTAEQRAEIEKEAQATFDAEVAYYMDFRFGDGMSEEDLRKETIAYLAENGISYENMFNEMSANIWRENLREYVVKDMSITDEDVRAYYESAVESAKLRYAVDFSEYEVERELGRAVVYNPAGVRTVQPILIAFNEEQIDSYLALQIELEKGDSAKLDEVEALYQQLMPRVQEVQAQLAQGRDFAEVMDEYSEDGNFTTMESSRTGYYISAASTGFDENFVSAAMGLEKIGDVSEPVYTDGGIYILRYASDVAEGEVPYEQVADALRYDCEQEIQASRYNEIVEQWMTEANVKYYPEKL